MHEEGWLTPIFDHAMQHTWWDYLQLGPQINRKEKQSVRLETFRYVTYISSSVMQNAIVSTRAGIAKVTDVWGLVPAVHSVVRCRGSALHRKETQMI